MIETLTWKRAARVRDRDTFTRKLNLLLTTRSISLKSRWKPALIYTTSHFLNTTSMSRPSSRARGGCGWVDPRVELTQRHIIWDVLSTILCKTYQVASAHWGDFTWGGYNLVRFLHLDDPCKTIVVARVPLCSLEGLSSEQSTVLCNRISSEVSTMEYVQT